MQNAGQPIFEIESTGVSSCENAAIVIDQYCLTGLRSEVEN